jgi:hypothetical protein
MTDYDDREPVVEPMEEEEPLRQENEGILDAFVRYQRKAMDEGCLAVQALIPPEFRAHGREAKRAFKRSFKVLLDEIAARIEEAEAEEETPQRPSTTGKTKVKVEVS